MKKLLREIGIRLLSIALVCLFLIVVSTIGSYLTSNPSKSLDHEPLSSYTFEQLTSTPTKPIVTPTPKPVLRVRLDPK